MLKTTNVNVSEPKRNAEFDGFVKTLYLNGALKVKIAKGVMVVDHNDADNDPIQVVLKNAKAGLLGDSVKALFV